MKILEWNLLWEAASHQGKSTESVYWEHVPWKAYSDILLAYSKYPTLQ